MMLAALIVVLILFTMLGMDVAWSIGLACFVYIALSQFTDNPTMWALFSQQMTVGIDSFVLVAIPLFIFAGELMNRCGVTQRLVDVANAFVGHWHGGLANVGIWSNFLMSGVSGSAVADAAATGTVLVPEMTKRGFPRPFACAVIACGATVGPIIPPSIVFLILGAVVSVSVGQLFVAGIIPGIMMSGSMFIVTWWICRKRGYPREAKATGAQRRAAVVAGIPALLAPAIIVGSIVGGIATPTEGAAIAVAYTLVLGTLFYRTLRWRDFVEAAGGAALASGLVMLLIATSQIFAWLAVQERLGEILTSSMLSISTNVYMILFMVNVLMIVLGTFMEIVPMIYILAPIMFPLLAKMGVSEVQFGVVMVLNLMLGMLSPPIGINLMVLQAVSGEDPMRIFRACIPYCWALVVVLALITYVPWFTTFLPRLFYGGG